MGVMRLEKRVDRFFQEPEVGSAYSVARNFRNLAISDVAAFGYRMRLGAGDPTALRVALERKGEELERVNFRSDFVPAVFLEQGAALCRAVCKIETEGVDLDGKQGFWMGTGFLVAPDILLTNHHVINSIPVGRNARCIFNYQVDAQGKPVETVAYKLDPDRLFITSPLDGGLDYTFVAIDPEASGRFGFVPMNRHMFTIHPGERANVIQHPQGRYKETVLNDNDILEDTGVVLHYTSDTEGGSSGSPVFNSKWELIALHHSSTRNDKNLKPANQAEASPFLNEGIKMSAIASDIESRMQSDIDTSLARKVLSAFSGIDSMMGFFGGLGRRGGQENSPLERVIDTYNGEARDIDVAFWNVEWFTNRYAEKVDEVADIIADFNLDIWALAESSPDAARALVDVLKTRHGLPFEAGYSEPSSPAGKQSTTVIWNTATVTGKRMDWPEEIDSWFKVRSDQFSDLNLEAVHGRVFDRYPGLFWFEARNRDTAALSPFNFHLVPLHLKAMSEGSLRRRMAAKILAAAIKRMIGQDFDNDWVVGGDFNAELATGDFDDMMGGGLKALSAEDEGQGAMSYLKSPKSLIDHIFLSANLAKTYGSDDYFIVAAEHDIPDYVKRVSDHRPVLVRLSLRDGVSKPGSLPDSLAKALGYTAPASS